MVKAAKDKTILMLGSIDHEGVCSTLTSRGLSYQKKMLHSRQNNWVKIIDLLKSGNFSVVLAKFTPTTYGYLDKADFEEVREELFRQLAAVPHVIFVFEDLLSGTLSDEEEDDEYEYFYRYRLEPELVARVNERIHASGLNVLPYTTRAEVTVSAVDFIESADAGLLFRLYIPSGKLWEREIDKLLLLFRDYLAKVGKLTIRLDQIRTNQGTIYSFCGDAIYTSDTLSQHFEEFSKLVDLCASDPDAAENILKHKNIDPREISHILFRYSKEARRLQVDMKQERESKLLSIRHRLESELIDVLPYSVDESVITRLIDSALPTISGLRSSLSAPCLPNLRGNQSLPFTVNITQQFIEKAQGIIAQEVCGDVRLSSEDRQLIELFQIYGGEKASELLSSLHELNDKSAPNPGRVTAKQRIQQFLITAGKKIGDAALHTFQSYLEKKLLGL
jgi:hypothetical protein